MTERVSSTSLHVPLYGSPTLRAINVVGHLLAIGAIVFMARTDALWWWAIPALLIDTLLVDRRMARRRRQSWRTLRWAGDNRIHWTTRSGRTGESQCVHARTWGRQWVRLRVEGQSGWPRRQNIVLPRDATTADAHRRMRVRCRIAPPQAASADED